MRTLVAGLEFPADVLLDEVAVPLLLPGRDALAVEAGLPLLRTLVAGLVTLVTPLLPEAAVVLLAVVVAELRVVELVVLLTVPRVDELRFPAVLLTAVSADDDLVTEELRTADEPLVPEIDEWELEASPPPVPLEP